MKKRILAFLFGLFSLAVVTVTAIVAVHIVKLVTYPDMTWQGFFLLVAGKSIVLFAKSVIIASAAVLVLSKFIAMILTRIEARNALYNKKG